MNNNDYRNKQSTRYSYTQNNTKPMNGKTYTNSKNTSTKPNQQKVVINNEQKPDTKGCLSMFLMFWFRSAVFSIAIYLALHFLGLLGGDNNFILNKESKVGTPTFSTTQEYNITDQDLETFTALMNENLTEEQKQAVYSLTK